MQKAPVKINSAFLPLYDQWQRYVENYGGRSSGKSWAASQLLVRRALENPGRRIVVMRKVATSIRISVWPRMQAAIDEAVGRTHCQPNKTDREIHLFNGSSFLFVGADDREKLKSIEGVTDYWLEEATEFDEQDFDVLDAGLRMNVDPPCQIWLSHNPIPLVPGMEHWIQRRFLQIEHEPGEITPCNGTAVVLHTTYQHNAFCPAETVRVLEAYKHSNPELYEMWALGKFTTLKGAILQNWDIAKAVPEGVSLMGYGLDFGFATDPAAIVKVWAHRDELWCQEKVYSTGLTNQELSAVMEEAGLRKGVDEIIADSAEPKSIMELRKLGWLVLPAKKSQDYKREAAQFLRSHTIHVLEGSTNMVKECGTWSWKQDRNGNVLPVVADGNDHLMDALIYRTFRKTVHWRPA